MFYVLNQCVELMDSTGQDRHSIQTSHQVLLGSAGREARDENKLGSPERVGSLWITFKYTSA